ncbi:MAG: hypothetical protein JW938_07475 [Candidatus Omnitrophica bacterium]|nr:hypothetical protein [Candidatus Omnitrophota bacterium]
MGTVNMLSTGDSAQYFKKLFLILGAVPILLFGCAYDQALFRAERLSDIGIGEERGFTVHKLGENYTPVLLENKGGDRFEVIEYYEKPLMMGKVTEESWRVYRIYFINDKLVGYERCSRGDAVIAYEKWLEESPQLSMPGKRVRTVSLSQYFD